MDSREIGPALDRYDGSIYVYVCLPLSLPLPFLFYTLLTSLAPPAARLPLFPRKFLRANVPYSVYIEKTASRRKA